MHIRLSAEGRYEMDRPSEMCSAPPKYHAARCREAIHPANAPAHEAPTIRQAVASTPQPGAAQARQSILIEDSINTLPANTRLALPPTTAAGVPAPQRVWNNRAPNSRGGSP